MIGDPICASAAAIVLISSQRVLVLVARVEWIDLRITEWGRPADGRVSGSTARVGEVEATIRGRLNGTGGVTSDTIAFMPMTLRLSDAEADALRRRAEQESRSMQDIARQAVREYVENHSRAELLDQVLNQELPRYAEALERLGQ